MNKKKTFVTSLLVLISLYTMSKFGESTSVFEFRSSHSSSFFDPLEFLTIYFVITSSILLFFNEKIFMVWLKKFMIWFFPLSLIVIAIGSVEVNYGLPTRTSLAIFMGSIMVVATLIITLIQRFYYKLR